ncbi:MAG TPA: hypothetical protein VGR02_13365 [Thermoanaerobaculia bacterium]|jgi:hypothetical protein|nr:hypothetical protein [Thermoanaerobaculia bacterium]
MKKFIGLALTSCLAAAALGQLNPTVQRLPRPSGPVPADCDTSSTVAAAPRLQVSEIPEPVPAALPPVAPPSSSLRVLLRETREAADRGDRGAFRIALAGVKATLRGYPAGAERRAAEETVRVYDDLDRLWTYQYESATGAFFDESSDAYRIVASYPGYTESIRRQTLTVGGRRLYPTTESRRFLAAEGARRLGGGKALPPAAVARTEPPPRTLTTVKPATAASGEQRAASRRTTHTPQPRRDVVHVAGHTSRTPAPAPAIVRRSPALAPAPRTPAPRTSTPAPAPAPAPRPPAPRTSTPAPGPAPAPRTSAPAPAPLPATPAPAPAPVPLPPPATETTATTASATTTAPPTETTATTAPAITDTAVAATATDTVEPVAPTIPQKGRGMVVPLILILIGLGVLVVLFRASSS